MDSKYYEGTMGDTRFDLEQDILQCWHITDDLKALAKRLGEETMPPQEIAQLINSIADLYNFRLENTFARFERLIHDRKIV